MNRVASGGLVMHQLIKRLFKSYINLGLIVWMVSSLNLVEIRCQTYCWPIAWYTSCNNYL